MASLSPACRVALVPPWSGNCCKPTPSMVTTKPPHHPRSTSPPSPNLVWKTPHSCYKQCKHQIAPPSFTLPVAPTTPISTPLSCPPTFKAPSTYCGPSKPSTPPPPPPPPSHASSSPPPENCLRGTLPPTPSRWRRTPLPSVPTVPPKPLSKPRATVSVVTPSRGAPLSACALPGAHAPPQTWPPTATCPRTTPTNFCRPTTPRRAFVPH